MSRPLVDPQTDRRPIMWASTRWVTYLQDPDGQVYSEFDGINACTTRYHGCKSGNIFRFSKYTAEVVEITLDSC